MKRLLNIMFFLAIVNLSFGWIWTEVEINKDSLPTIAELEYLKILLPKEKVFINQAVAAVQEGGGFVYGMEFTVVTDTPAKQILRVELVTPAPANKVYVYIYDGSFKDSDDVLYEFYVEKEYLSFDPMKADFPAGVYTVRIIGKTNQIIDEDSFTIPEYSESDFLEMPQGQTSWENNILKLDWSTVAGDDDNEYSVTANNLKADDEIQDEDTFAVHPENKTTLFDRVKKGRYECSVSVEASYEIGSNIYMDSETEWFVFKKPLPVYEDKATKCTVTAGPKKDFGDDTLSFGGQLTALEADFLNAQAVSMKISCDTGLDSIGIDFPINPTTLKNGLFSSTVNDPTPGSKATATFKYDTKTHLFVLTIKNFNLTGLSCPITVDIGIGDYYDATLTLHEAVVNGAKACPPILIQGLADSLVIEKYTLTAGKQYGLDSFIASGIFTYTGTPDNDSEPFSIILGAQSFTVDGLWFNEKNGVYTCKNAPTKENWNGETVTALLDTNKCTFTFAVRNTYLSDSGSKLVKLNFFGLMLSSAEPLNLGALYSFWELTQYDQLNRQWMYTVQSDIGSTIVTVHDNGLDKYRITEEESDGALATLFYAKNPSYDGAMRFNLLSIESSGPDVYIGMDTDLSMWFPARMRPGHIYTSSSAVSGYMSALGYGLDIVNGTGTGKTIINPKMVNVKVPAGEFSTVSFTQTWSLSGKLDYSGTIVGSVSIACTQTDYAVPGFGVVQRVRKFVMKASGGGRSISDTTSVTYKLLP